MRMSPPHHSDRAYYVSGDVTVDPSAAIAPGVVLRADPDSRIAIAAGVSIGMGTIVHAHHGILEVEKGACIGAGVLVVGTGKIGVNACLGSDSTAIDPAVEAQYVVASGSLIGDRSRRVEESPPETAAEPEPEPIPEPEAIPEPEPEPKPAQTEPPIRMGPQVYGHTHINELLKTLLPHRRNPITPPNSGSPPSG
jgi:carbon dioxide concentrating mechanism protein CcmN